jgi:Holliday junction resolvase RusA-like endonuclease
MQNDRGGYAVSYTLEFELQGLPRMNTGFGRSNRFAQSRETQKWKSKVHLACMGRLPPEPLSKAKLTLTRFSSVRPDYDNRVISLKPVIDGLVQALVLHDDNEDVIGVPEYLWEKCSPKEGRIRVRVEQITEEK